MELYFLRHAEYERIYNCSGINVDGAIPLAQRQHVPEACLSIGLCAFYYILYAPCVYSLAKNRHTSACYQLLFYLALADVGMLWIPGFLHGFLALQGAVFCSYPTLIYFAGSLGVGLWGAECSADLVLGINRCLEIARPQLAEALFAGLRVFVWMGMCTLYALYWLLFERPAIFNGLFFSWTFYPFLGYRQDMAGMADFEHTLAMFTIHDTILAIGSPIVYGLFALILFLETRHRTMFTMSTAEKMIFLQVLIISALNSTVGILYAYNMRQQVPKQYMITIAHFAWLHIHGFPPVIYLALNKTVRADARRLLYKCIGREEVSNSTTGVRALHNLGSLASHTLPQLRTNAVSPM